MLAQDCRDRCVGCALHHCGHLKGCKQERDLAVSVAVERGMGEACEEAGAAGLGALVIQVRRALSSTGESAGVDSAVGA